MWRNVEKYGVVWTGQMRTFLAIITVEPRYSGYFGKHTFVHYIEFFHYWRTNKIREKNVLFSYFDIMTSYCYYPDFQKRFHD